MYRTSTGLVFSATDLSNFLACPHVTTLDLAVQKGEHTRPPKFPDPAAEVVRERGKEHEAEVLQHYRSQGLEVAEVRQPDDDATAADNAHDLTARWRHPADATRAAMEQAADVIYQGCLFDGHWMGFPDFLVKVDQPSDLGDWSYEVVDAKLAREAKAGAVLQITLYSDLLKAVQGTEPAHMHLALGRMAGETERFRYHDFAAYYRSVRARFAQAVSSHRCGYQSKAPIWDAAQTPKTGGYNGMA